ncbi:hypothetical protein TELCIR_01611 [Teladorsagia circumcincta]|uniref:RNA-directed DNA polymerase n=1 Tax=Teladorsagia circumcincta TaxID=45464 RepID=A0A2G9V1F4_TELCI|nr:hypothetical protein TELCIR_01611 [Teladorsagia circumcincta]
MLARNYVYWTNINQDIEKFVKTCRRCQETAKKPVKTTLCSWPLEDKPWNRIHADFAGPLDGKMYLIVVDAYSKWPEIVEMSSTTTGSTTRELRRLFAHFGNPQRSPTERVQRWRPSMDYRLPFKKTATYTRSNMAALRLNADTNLHYPDSTPELADLPLLPTSKQNHLSKGHRFTQHEARTNTQPSSMDTSGAVTMPTEEATGQRRIRQRRAPERLMVDPRKKTYA